METHFSHYEDSTEYVCCLPGDGKMGKEVTNDQMLGMWKRQTVLISTEDGEKYVASDDAKKNT